jgi:hypothetical protein
MAMKKIFSCCIMAVCVVAIAVAQPPLNKINQYRQAFLIERLQLTDTEAQKFLPLLQEREGELFKIRQQRKQQMERDLASLSDAEIEKLIRQHFEMEQKELDIHKKYFEKFKTVLPMKKIALLARTEQDFKRELLERMRNRQPLEGGNIDH